MFRRLLKHLVNAILQMDSHTDAFYNAKQQERFSTICCQKINHLLCVLRPHYTKLQFLVFPNANKITFHLKSLDISSSQKTLVKVTLLPQKTNFGGEGSVKQLLKAQEASFPKHLVFPKRRFKLQIITSSTFKHTVLLSHSLKKQLLPPWTTMKIKVAGSVISKIKSLMKQTQPIQW